MNLTNSTTIFAKDNIQILRINNTFASAEISLFGGHVISFTPKHDRRERLWLSQKALFDGKKAIRGGVPICWPWFGDHPTNNKLAAHGYVRNQNWNIQKTEEIETATVVSLTPSTSAGLGFEGNAQLTLVVYIGKQLKIQLHTENLGDKPFTFNCALHSYFTITDITQCELIGLSGQYIDKTCGYKSLATPKPYKFNQETDRVHLQRPKLLFITDNIHGTEIVSTGHDSIVVWNPWQHKSISMGDMADDSYLTMLCVETAITQDQTVGVKDTHILEQIIK